MKEALLYEKIGKGLVRCYLCAHFCRIREKGFGFCGVRQNIAGELFTYSYGKVVASYVDPVEKKPLYHFFPGSLSFSIAAAGCNFRCGFCQNWQISQAPDIGAQAKEVSPKEIVKAALDSECRSISYTYTEPTIFFEYALDVAKSAKVNGLFNVFVTNGYMTEEALLTIRPYLDASNVDLKFFKERSYRKICKATLQPVLGTIERMVRLGVWVEITTLLIPGENDSDEELSGIAGFIAKLDKNIPWHISRFHPEYKFIGYETTPESTLERAQKIGSHAGLKFIYIGNVPGSGSDTYCPECKKLLIKREFFNVSQNNLEEGRCSFCRTAIAGVFRKGFDEAN
ncbi:MAG: AmmeMemoRadiSam system radical SAM enzyme [Candidatus Omnitrophota bacterium]|jgi:pyruvate formate lyase activating enzyme